MALMMLKLLPLLLVIAYVAAMAYFSVWRTKRMLDAQSAPLDDPDIATLADRMAQAQGVPSIKVHVFEIEPVNGLAAPDGRIFLTRGFLDKKARGEVTDAELASVIAHELGHVALGHVRRRMIDFVGQNAVMSVLSVIISRFLPFVGVWILNFLSSLVMARLSRRDEFEADAYATALLIKSGIGTGPQISLFQKLEALTGNRGGDTPAWLRSHPKSAERIAAIQANAQKWVQPA